MTKKRRRRKPEQIVRAIQEGEATLAAGKSEAEVFQTLEISTATWDRWTKQLGRRVKNVERALWPINSEVASSTES